MLPRFAVPVWLLLAVITTAMNAKGQAIPADAGEPACVARELSRRPLIVEGERELYLEPVVFAVSGDRVLLAGKPSYVFVRRTPGTMAELESRHSIFGAVINADGTAQTISPPPVNDGKVTAVAGSGTDAGHWRMIFAEVDSIPEPHQVVSGYWHGIYDGTAWTDLERLPDLEGARLLFSNSSRLAQNADTIVWASLSQLPPWQRRVAVFERRGGVWSHHMPTTAFASAVEVIHTPNLGFVLSVLSRKAVLNSEQAGSDGTRELFFYPQRSGWQFHRKIDMGEDPTIIGGTTHFSGETGVATWFSRKEDVPGSRLELRAMVGAIIDGDRPVVTVDRDAVPQFAPVVGPGDVAWVTHHSNDSSDSSDAGELRLVRWSGSETQVLWRTPQPYLGPFVATYSGADVLIVGPQLDREHELLVSLMIRLRIECNGNKQPGG